MKKETQTQIFNKGESIKQNISDIQGLIQEALNGDKELSEYEYLNLKESHSNLEFALGNVVHALNLMKNL